jgi:CHAD domain-containing protein
MLPGVESGDVKAVHRARVASRRLRELVPVLQLERDTAQKLRKRLKKATRQLGALRELDVLLELTDELLKSGRHAEHALRRVASDVRKARDGARRKVRSRNLAGDFKRVLKYAEKAGRQLPKTEDGNAARAWKWAIDARVARRASSLKSAIAKAGAIYLPARVHGVRIALKKLRYGVELLGEATGADVKSDLRALKRVQRLLGRLHDVQVLVDRVRHVQASLNPPDIVAWKDLDLLVIALDQNCRRLHARYVSEREGLVAMCDRFAARVESTPRAAAARRAAGGR